MGIPSLLNLLKSVTVKKHLSEYKNQVVAIDVYTWLHPALFTCSYELANNIDTTKHIEFCMKRAEGILSYGIKKLVLVFDGRQLPSKKNTEENREKQREESKIEAEKLYAEGKKDLAYKKFASSIDVTPQMAFEFISAMRGNKDVECIVSPYEADAQLAYLSKTNYVDVVFSEDSDLLAFGCKRVLFKLYKGEQRDIGDEICLENIKNCKEINMSLWDQNMFLTACIFSGCDYLPSLKRMGINTAFKLVGENKSYKKCLYSMRSRNYDVPVGYDEKFEYAFLTFRFQLVYCPISEHIVHLNSYDLNAMKVQYIDKDFEHLTNPFNWKDFEENVLLTPLIIKILSSNFSWDFLGDMDEETAIKVSKGEIDPETLLPYKETKRLDGLYLDSSSITKVSSTCGGGGILALQSKSIMMDGKNRNKKTNKVSKEKQSTINSFLKSTVQANFIKFSQSQNEGEGEGEKSPFLIEQTCSQPERFSNLDENQEVSNQTQLSKGEVSFQKNIFGDKKRSDLKKLRTKDYFSDEGEEWKDGEGGSQQNKQQKGENMVEESKFFNSFKSNSLISKNLSGLKINEGSEGNTKKGITSIKDYEKKLCIDKTPLQEIQIKRTSLLKNVFDVSKISKVNPTFEKIQEQSAIQEEEENNFSSLNVLSSLPVLEKDYLQIFSKQLQDSSHIKNKDWNSSHSRLDEFSKIENGEVVIDTQYLLKKYPEYNFLEKFKCYFSFQNTPPSQTTFSSY